MTQTTDLTKSNFGNYSATVQEYLCSLGMHEENAAALANVVKSFI